MNYLEQDKYTRYFLEKQTILLNVDYNKDLYFTTNYYDFEN